MTLRPDWLPALAAFEAAARHQNFAHAADELHLTASAVSHHVRKLEARLGVPLFQRHARGVSLTAEGRQLADVTGSAMTDIEGVLSDLRVSDDARERHRVRITTLHSWTHSWLLARLPQFSALHPDIRLNIDTEVALTRFDQGGPDLGIRHGLGHWPGLTAHFLMDDALFPVAAPSFPGIASIDGPAHIATLPLVSDLARQGWADWFRAAGLHGVHLDERYVFSDSTASLNAATHGLGIALARARIVPPWLANGRLQRLPGPTLKTRFDYYVVYPSHRRLRPAARCFVDWLLGLQQD